MKTKIILLVLLCSPLYFFGWGAEGHQMVAEIAKKKLNPGVEQKVQKYLGSKSFKEAAVWMDEIKSDHTFDYMKPWHFANIEKGAIYQKPKEGDIVSELEAVIAELKNYKSMKEEDVNKDLKILFHLCGDMVQPLHVGYGSDKGGNSYKVTYNGKETNLHHVWDSDIIKSQNITVESCLKKTATWGPDQIAIVQKVDVMYWMNDSRSFLTEVYTIQNNAISADYIKLNGEIIEKQITKGGLRLAAVLNEIFKS